MTAYDEAVQRYFAAWNTTGAEDRAKAVAAAFTADARYTAPWRRCADTRDWRP